MIGARLTERLTAPARQAGGLAIVAIVLAAIAILIGLSR